MKGPTTTMSMTPFDLAAGGYDLTFEPSPVTRHNRRIFHGSLLRHFHAGDRVLELACGTGTDALFLAAQGVCVTAIDASGQMIRKAEAKVQSRKLDSLVTLRHLSIEKLESLAGERFDGACSNFGGLNCTPNLEAAAQGLAQLVKPGGSLVVCLLNRACLWEIASFAARGQFAGGLRRFKTGGVDAPVGGLPQHVWYHTPRSFLATIRPWFDPIRIIGMNIFSPSPNSSRFVARHPFITDSLLMLDGIVRRLPPFRNLGDHFVVEARRRDDDPTRPKPAER